jgi:hypothetical protein
LFAGLEYVLTRAASVGRTTAATGLRAELGGKDDLAAALTESLAEQRLRLARGAAVDIRHIEKIDAGVQRSIDDLLRDRQTKASGPNVRVSSFPCL